MMWPYALSDFIFSLGAQSNETENLSDDSSPSGIAVVWLLHQFYLIFFTPLFGRWKAQLCLCSVVFSLFQGVEDAGSATEQDESPTRVEDFSAPDVEDSTESQLQDNSTSVQKNSTHLFINCSRTENITPEVEVS